MTIIPVTEDVLAQVTTCSSIKGTSLQIKVPGDIILEAGRSVHVRGQRVYLNSKQEDLDYILEQEGVPAYARTKSVRT